MQMMGTESCDLTEFKKLLGFASSIYGKTCRYLKVQLNYNCATPQVSGQSIWCHQLKRQFDQHVRRVEAVLGSQWNLRMNGKDLAARISPKIDPMILVKKWEEAKSYPNFDDKISIFRIDKGVGKSLSLNVNFDENYVKLFKEVRCLIQLGVRIDIGLRLSCIDVKQKYPIAVKLKDAVSIYQRSCKEMSQNSSKTAGVCFYIFIFFSRVLFSAVFVQGWCLFFIYLFFFFWIEG